MIPTPKSLSVYLELASREQGLAENPTVSRVRAHIFEKINLLYGRIKIFGISHPVYVDWLYVDVNMLEEPTHTSRLEISDLASQFDGEKGRSESIENFNRLGLSNFVKRLPFIEALKMYPRIMVLGKPGSGKTTLLQYLVTQCIYGALESERIPVFLKFRELTPETEQGDKFDLIRHIQNQWEIVSESEVINLLRQGRALIFIGWPG